MDFFKPSRKKYLPDRQIEKSVIVSSQHSSLIRERLKRVSSVITANTGSAYASEGQHYRSCMKNDVIDNHSTTLYAVSNSDRKCAFRNEKY